MLDEMFKAAQSFVYVAVSTAAASQSLPNGSPAPCNVQTPEWWKGQLELAAKRRPGIRWYLRAVDRADLAGTGRFFEGNGEMARAVDVMLQYQNIKFDYEPFPIGVARPAFAPDTYRPWWKAFRRSICLNTKPTRATSIRFPGQQSGKYRRYVQSSAPWRAFHEFIRSGAFVSGAVEMLKRNGFDLGLPIPGFAERLYLKARAIKRGNPCRIFPTIKSRFEFSAMPITGGNILPHTDHPKKLITMVVPMLRDDEWNDAWAVAHRLSGRRTRPRSSTG